MSRPAFISPLPTWVLELVHQLERAEEEHPTYYVENRAALADVQLPQYVRAECRMEQLLALVPDEVRVAVDLASRWGPRSDLSEHVEGVDAEPVLPPVPSPAYVATWPSDCPGEMRPPADEPDDGPDTNLIAAVAPECPATQLIPAQVLSQEQLASDIREHILYGPLPGHHAPTPSTALPTVELARVDVADDDVDEDLVVLACTCGHPHLTPELHPLSCPIGQHALNTARGV